MRGPKKQPGTAGNESPKVKPADLLQPPDAASLPGGTNVARAELLQSLRHTNERCIDLLMQAARRELKETFPLVGHLRDLFRGLTPEARERAARTALLVVDMQLCNASWWRFLQAHPSRAERVPPSRGSFPRAPAVQLGRATLMLVWHTVHVDPAGSCLLGVSTEVARIIGSYSLTELDQIVERRFQYVRPRWEERPAVWRAVLLSAQRDDPRRTRDVTVWALQLITGDLLSRAPAKH